MYEKTYDKMYDKKRVHKLALAFIALKLVKTKASALKKARLLAQNKDARSIEKIISALQAKIQTYTLCVQDFRKKNAQMRTQVKKNVAVVSQSMKRDTREMIQARSKLKYMRKNVVQDTKVHKFHTADAKESKQDVGDLQCSAQDTAYVLAQARKIQRSGRHK